MRQRNDRHSVPKEKNHSPQLADLFKRIHIEHLHDKQRERIAHFKHTFIYLLIAIFALYIFGCHTRVYNALVGPFHLTIDEFAMYLDDYNDIDLGENPSRSSWFSFYREYLQIELGNNQIEEETEHILSVFSHSPSTGSLMYTFNKVKVLSIVVNLHPDKLYVKLPSIEKSHFHSYHPYHFQLFKTKTLQCIVRQLNISPKEYLQWIEKSMYIKIIEQIYAQNATAFNMKVIARCGILLGYLYRPKGESAYAVNSKYLFKFNKLDLAFDASSSYYPYKTFLLGGILFSWLFIKALLYVLLYLFYRIYWPTLRIHSTIEEYLNTLEIDSLEKLDDLLLNTTSRNNYCDRLFLLHNRYLLILNINWNEDKTSILLRFYNQDPFIIVSLNDIIHITQNGIATKHGSQQICYPLPTIGFKWNRHGIKWLHQRLIDISSQYRHYYEEQERLQNEMRYQQQQQQERQRHLAVLITEEEQYQANAFRNNYEMMWNQIIPASPRFIAEFRLTIPEQVDDNLCNTSCTICLENFEYDDDYAQWPCEAKHAFHCNCMLNTLRSQHTCPLCRHSVERSDYAVQLMMSRYFYRIFI